MKKILYILFTVSLLAAGCTTTEVAVSRDHDINAEVGDMKTKMEMKTLYCNLNETNNLDLQKLSEYLTAQNADVAMFVAPVTVGGENFKNWLTAYAAEVGELNALSVANTNGRLLMAALVKNQWPLKYDSATVLTIERHRARRERLKPERPAIGGKRLGDPPGLSAAPAEHRRRRENLTSLFDIRIRPPVARDARHVESPLPERPGIPLFEEIVEHLHFPRRKREARA